MASYFYVKSGFGIRTTDTSFTSPETGAFGSGNLTDANCYDSLDDAYLSVTTPPTDGDFVFLSDIHSASITPSSGILLNDTGSENGVGVRLISVNDTDVTLYKPGASETITGNDNEYNFKYNGFLAGLSLETADNTITTVGPGHWVMQDATFTSDTSNDRVINMASTGCYLQLINVDLKCNNVGCIPIFVASGAHFNWYGGALVNNCTFIIDGFFGSGAVLNIIGVDLSDCTGTIVEEFGTSGDATVVTLTQCKFNASSTLVGTFNKLSHRLEVYSSDSFDYHTFHVQSAGGIAKNNDATYVTATESWYEGSVKSSIEIYTTAVCSRVKPFIFELPAQYVDLSVDDLITLELVSSATLTDTDIAAFLVYPDGTTAVQPNWITSGKTVGTGNYGTDPLAAGTELDDSVLLDADDWTDEPSTPNFYKIELDTSGDAGQATAVSIRIEVYKASISLDSLFIHPLVTI